MFYIDLVTATCVSYLRFMPRTLLNPNILIIVTRKKLDDIYIQVSMAVVLGNTDRDSNN